MRSTYSMSNAAGLPGLLAASWPTCTGACSTAPRPAHFGPVMNGPNPRKGMALEASAPRMKMRGQQHASAEETVGDYS